MWFVHGFVNVALAQAAPSLVPAASSAISMEISEPPMISYASVLAT
jgi:hypothetical protein